MPKTLEDYRKLWDDADRLKKQLISQIADSIRKQMEDAITRAVSRRRRKFEVGITAVCWEPRPTAPTVEQRIVLALEVDVNSIGGQALSQIADGDYSAIKDAIHLALADIPEEFRVAAQLEMNCRGGEYIRFSGTVPEDW